MFLTRDNFNRTRDALDDSEIRRILDCKVGKHAVLALVIGFSYPVLAQRASPLTQQKYHTHYAQTPRRMVAQAAQPCAAASPANTAPLPK